MLCKIEHTCRHGTETSRRSARCSPRQAETNILRQMDCYTHRMAARHGAGIARIPADWYIPCMSFCSLRGKLG